MQKDKLHDTNKKKLSNFSFVIKIDEKVTAHQQCVKYLRIMVDEKMSWANHINYLNTKLCRRAWAISQLKNYTDTYYSLIYPHLKYCIISCKKANTKTLQPLITTQRVF